jgi:hypothetical protein
MPKSPFISFAPFKPDRPYLALLSYLPLRHFRAIPNFFRYTTQMQRRLKTTPSVVGCAF